MRNGGLDCESAGACLPPPINIGFEYEIVANEEWHFNRPPSVVYEYNGKIMLADWDNCGEHRIHTLTTPSIDENFVFDYDKRSGDSPVSMNGYNPRLHPHFYKIAFQRKNAVQPSEGSDIYVATYMETVKASTKPSIPAVPLQFFREVNLMNTPGRGEIEPCWSPDGSKLAFSDWDHGVVVVNADGTGRQTLVSLPYCHDLEWSPDGSLIAFSRKTALQDVDYILGPTAIHDVYVADVRGKALHRLTYNANRLKMGDISMNAIEPAWHPSGQLVFGRQVSGYEVTAFVIDTGLPVLKRTQSVETRLWVWNGDWTVGSRLEQLTFDFPEWFTDYSEMDRHPVCTPDGEYVLFWSQRLGNGFKLIRMPFRPNLTQSDMREVPIFLPSTDSSHGSIHINWRYTNYEQICLSVWTGDGGLQPK